MPLQNLQLGKVPLTVSVTCCGMVQNLSLLGQHVNLDSEAKPYNKNRGLIIILQPEDPVMSWHGISNSRLFEKYNRETNFKGLSLSV